MTLIVLSFKTLQNRLWDATKDKWFTLTCCNLKRHRRWSPQPCSSLSVHKPTRIKRIRDKFAHRNVPMSIINQHRKQLYLYLINRSGLWIPISMYDYPIVAFVYKMRTPTYIVEVRRLTNPVVQLFRRVNLELQKRETFAELMTRIRALVNKLPDPLGDCMVRKWVEKVLPRSMQ